MHLDQEEAEEMNLREQLVDQVSRARLENELRALREQNQQLNRRLDDIQETVLAAVTAGVRGGQPEAVASREGTPSTVSVALSGRLSVANAGKVVPVFDPDRADSESCGSAREWLAFVEQMARVHGWSDEEKVLLIHMQLEGEARRWFRNQVGLIEGWPNWRRALLEAFPEAREFHAQLQAVSNRTKRPGETFTDYYRDVVRLCEGMGTTPEQTVSCLIGELPPHLQANADVLECSTPRELFNKLLSKLDARVSTPGVKTRQQPRETLPTPRPQRPYLAPGPSRGVLTPRLGPTAGRGTHPAPLSSQPRPGPSSSERRCFNCQQLGHVGRDCPVGRRDDVCRYCKEVGHFKNNCPNKPGARPYPQPPRRNVSAVSMSVPGYKKLAVTPEGSGLTAYLDTGSEFNIITPGCVSRLGLETSPTNVDMAGFGGSSTTARRKTQLKLTLDRCQLTVDAVVAELHLPQVDLLIGQPILNGGTVHLRVTGDKVVVEDILEGTAAMEIQPKAHQLRLVHEVKLGPYCARLALVHVPGRYRGEPVKEVPARILQGDRQPVAMSKVTFNPRSDTAEVFLTNMTPTEVTFQEGAVLAKAYGNFGGGLEKVATQPMVSHIPIISSVCMLLGELDLGEISKDHSRQLMCLLSTYSDCFAENSMDVGTTPLAVMEINLTSTRPVVRRPYRLAQSERAKVKDKIQELLNGGIIRESDSDYASPIIIVPKKDGDIRLCVDYRELNKITVKDRYPLPLIEDQLDKLSGSRYYTTLDLVSGFHQIKISEKSIHKTAFVTPDGHYEYVRMPFGLANSPAVFQRAVNKMLGNLTTSEVLAYMDDVLIPSDSVEGGIEKLRKVLERVREAKFKLNLKKCSFMKTTLNYLGHQVTMDGIQPGEVKTRAVKEFPTPTQVHQVRQFVGLASYFRKFVKNFALIARPLTELTKKNVPWRWENEQQAAFECLKEELCSRPILAIYRQGGETELHTDASKMGLGGILLQNQSDGSLKPVMYFSRVTSTTEQLYHSYDLETLAAVEAIRRFKVYLVGVPFKLVTDCVALRATFEKKDMVPRVARWWLSIQDLEFKIEYRPGTSMRHVDALSRNPLGVSAIIGEEDWFLTVQLQDDNVQNIYRQLESGVADKQIKEDFKIKHGRLWRKTADGERLYVPKMARFSLLKRCHDDVGHPGKERTKSLIEATYWFPRMKRFVQKYVGACIPCAFSKGSYGKQPGHLHPIEKFDQPFDTLHIDHLGPFVRSLRGNAYLLVIVDAFTKFVILHPVKTVGSREAIRKLKETFGIFGSPRRIISDRGKAFTSKVFREFLGDRGVKHVLNAISTPRANGQVERYNRTITEAITASVQDEASWDEVVPQVAWGINNTRSSATKELPAKLMFALNGGAAYGDLSLTRDSTGEISFGEGMPRKSNGKGDEELHVAHDLGGDSRQVDVNTNHRNQENSKRNRRGRKRSYFRATGETSEELKMSNGENPGDLPKPTQADLGDESSCSPNYQPQAKRLSLRRSARIGQEIIGQGSGVQGAEETNNDISMERVTRRRQGAKNQLEKRRREIRERFNRNRKKAIAYRKGELVLWREATTYTTTRGVNSKLAKEFSGPYKICKVLPHDRYEIMAIQGVRGYKNRRFLVAANSLRRYSSTAPGLSTDESSSDEKSE